MGQTAEKVLSFVGRCHEDSRNTIIAHKARRDPMGWDGMGWVGTGRDGMGMAWRWDGDVDGDGDVV